MNSIYSYRINFNQYINNNRSSIKFPQNLDDIKSLASTLKKYKSEHIGYVVLLFCSALLYKQSFAIPGSFMMVNRFYNFSLERFFSSNTLLL